MPDTPARSLLRGGTDDQQRTALFVIQDEIWKDLDAAEKRALSTDPVAPSARQFLEHLRKRLADSPALKASLPASKR